VLSWVAKPHSPSTCSDCTLWVVSTSKGLRRTVTSAVAAPCRSFLLQFLVEMDETISMNEEDLRKTREYRILAGYKPNTELRRDGRNGYFAALFGAFWKLAVTTVNPNPSVLQQNHGRAD
jgi:hypothetical protein